VQNSSAGFLQARALKASGEVTLRVQTTASDRRGLNGDPFACGTRAARTPAPGRPLACATMP